MHGAEGGDMTVADRHEYLGEQTVSGGRSVEIRYADRDDPFESAPNQRGR
jgi:hypothetical protein